MATYENDLRLKEITTGDEAGTWGTSTNTNMSLVAEAFSYGVENLGSDANATLTVADGATDEARSFYLKLTSTTLSATRTVTIAPQSLSKVWIIENATTGGQSLVITQGGGQHGVTIASGQVKVVYSTGDSESPSGVYDAFDSLAVTLAANAVGTANITDANVTLAKMAINSVNASKIIAASITDTELAANAVVTAGITDANVTLAKMAVNSINASNIINASITSTEMTPNAVEAVNIAANAVTTVKIADDAVDADKLGINSVVAASIVAASITSTELAANAVLTVGITDANVTTAKIADDAVTAAKLATNAVVTASIVAGSVTAAEIANNAITSNEIGALANLTVTGDVTIDSSTSPAQSTLKVDSSNNRVGIGVDSPDVSLDIGSMTDSIHVPVGTTAERPGSPAAGYFRYNATLEQFEGYTSEWGAIGGGGGTNTFTTDIFTDSTSPGVDGSSTVFYLSQTVSDENDILVFIDGVFQAQDAYSIATTAGETAITFSAAPSSGRTITVYSVATAVSGSNLGISTMTGDGSDTTLTLTADPVHENNVQVYFDGVYQSKSNFTVDGTTLTFSDAPPDGVLVEAMTLTQTNINTATKLEDADKDTMIQVEESSDEDIIRFDIAGAEDFTITANNLNVLSGSNATFADDSKAIFGTSGDGLEIYHNGSNSFIDDSGTGNLQIRANAQVKLQKYTGENMFVGIADGAASMYHDNVQRIATTSSGMAVYGDGVADLTFGNIGPSSNSALRISRDDTSITSGNPLGYLEFGGKDNTSNADTGHAYVAALASGAHAAGDNPTDLTFGTTPDGSSTMTERMRIDESGNVGIGTTSPDTLLDIEYSASNHTQGIHLSNKTGGGYGNRICFNSTRSDNSALEIAATIRTEGQTAWNSNANENSQLVFSVDSASTLSDRMFLNYRGALKVRAGDSLATFASGTDYTHEIWQDQAGYGIIKLATSGGTTNQYGLMVDMADDITNTSNWFQRCMAGTDSRFYIYSNGDVYTKTGTDIQQSSDRRLKDNITDYSGGLKVLNSLSPRTYTWKEGQGAAGTQYGFVAQEIEESSEVVDNMNLFSIVTPQREDDKNSLQPDDKQYNTQLSSKDAIYVSAIQELSKEIETLKAEVKTLKGE